MNRAINSIKIHVRENNTTRIQMQLPESLIYLFSIAQLCFGLNFGFVNPSSKRLKHYVNFTMMFMAFVIITFHILCSYMTDTLWTIYFLTHYLTSFIVLLFSTRTLYQFLTDMMVIMGDQPRDSTVTNLGAIAWFYMTFLFATKTACLIIILSTVCLGILIEITWLALDCISVANFILFYVVFIAMRNLKKELVAKKIDMEHFCTSYKAIADSFEKFRSSYDAVVSSDLNTLILLLCGVSGICITLILFSARFVLFRAFFKMDDCNMASFVLYSFIIRKYE